MSEFAISSGRSSPSPLSIALLVAFGAGLSSLLVLDKPLIYLVAVPGAAVAIAVLRQPLLGLYLTAAALPIDIAGTLVSITGTTFRISIAWVCTLLTLASWGVDSLLKRRSPAFPAEVWVLLAYVAVGIISLTTALEFSRGVEEVVRMVLTILFFLLVLNLVQTSKQLNTILALLVISSVFTFAYALGQKFFLPATIIEERGIDWLKPGAVTYGVELGKVDTQGLEHVDRVTGTTIHSGVLALNCAYMLPFIMVYQQLHGSMMRQALSWGAVLLLIGAFGTTLSRAGFLTLGFTLLMLVWTGILKITGVRLIAILLLLVLGIPFLPPGFVDRVLSPESYMASNSASLNGRLELWSASLRAIMDHPLSGFGIGNEHGIFSYWKPELRDQLGTVLNTWLQIAMEAGIPAMLLFVLFIWLLFRRLKDGRRRFRAQGNRAMFLVGTALFVLMCALVVSWMSFEFLRAGFKNVWLLLACIVAYHRISLAEPLRPAKSPTAPAPAPSPAP